MELPGGLVEDPAAKGLPPRIVEAQREEVAAPRADIDHLGDFIPSDAAGCKSMPRLKPCQEIETKTSAPVIRQSKAQNGID